MQGQGYIHNIYSYDPDYKPSANRNYTISDNCARTIFNEKYVQPNSTNEATLAHELKHSYDRSLKQLNKTPVVHNEIEQNFTESEWDAINVQNQILHNQGKDLRKDYNGVPIPKDKFIQPNADDKPIEQKVNTTPQNKSNNENQSEQKNNHYLNTGSGPVPYKLN